MRSRPMILRLSAPFALFAAVLLLWIATPGSLSAETEYVSIVELGASYVHEDGRLELGDDLQFTQGEPSYAVGYVSGFLGPLAHLDALEPGVEYTWCTVDLVSAGGVLADKEPDCHGMSLAYARGRFLLMRDETPDADISAPATFADGEVLLEGGFAVPEEWPHYGLDFFAWGCGNTGPKGADAWMRLDLDGGSAYSLLDPNGSLVEAGGLGTFETAYTLPSEITDLGYYFRFEATLSAEIPVAVRSLTWGRLKQLF